ncbi:hypothetical protein HQQ80_20650 [Microbacteriaceae bacterium VKM Ac-2855]|nr:hypothetical protein [Microbacteriaceae bacterium VKM Ac-2855]
MLAVAMLVPAGAAACCLVADPHRRSSRVWFPVALMMLAMVDSALIGAVPGLLWAAALVGAAMTSALAGRMAGGADAMQLHRAVAGVVMAVLLVGMPGGDSVGGHDHGLGLVTVSAFAVVGFTVAGVWIASQEWRRGRRVLAAEPVLMALSLGLMWLGH